MRMGSTVENVNGPPDTHTTFCFCLPVGVLEFPPHLSACICMCVCVLSVFKCKLHFISLQYAAFSRWAWKYKNAKSNAAGKKTAVCMRNELKIENVNVGTL